MTEHEILNLLQLAKSTKTTILDLTNLNLEYLPPEIGLLDNLRELKLKDNQLTSLPTEISNLSSLQVLILRKNNFTEFPKELFMLKNLVVLDLAENRLKAIPHEIAHLSNLKRLYISENELVTLPPEFSELANLTGLYIGGNLISDFPTEVSRLKNLQVLSMRGNLLRVIHPSIGDMTSLKELRLDNNKLFELPIEITKLIGHLDKLDLRGNPIPIDPELLLDTRLPTQILASIFGDTNQSRFIPPINDSAFVDSSLERVLLLIEESINSNSTSLDLQNLALNDFPIEATNLSQLTWISVNHNNLKELPSEIGKLSNLAGLSCGVNFIEELPSEICLLQKLRVLRASDNKISIIPKEIGKLVELRELALRDNQIVELPDEIGLLSELTELDLRGNRISNLPKSILNLRKLRYLDLRNNPIPLPLEIIERIDDPNAIINLYFSHLGKKRKHLHEAKIILVGQGSVGKTSIVNRLTNGQFNISTPKTEGIAINTWLIDNNRSKEMFRIKLNLWDFGGQEIMHATHQFFLTKRSLYLLVLDSRLTQEENRVEYWLKIIQSFGGESPVLIVGNKIDQHPLDIDRTGLQKKYPNIVGILETSAATGGGIEELKLAITGQVNNLPHVRDLLPETWFTVKTKLEGLGRESNFMTHDKYLELCAENEVSDETSQRTLIGFLHDLGVVLHFQDDPRLEALGILNPQWVTNGVYKILNSHTLFQNKGVLTVAMLDEILNLPEYPRGKRLFIVDMMKKFELCYDIEPDKTFLVPDLLPKDQPDLKFNGLPAFEYAYPVLPSSVITRLIVRMNQKIDAGLVWRTGVVLKIGDNHALVKADIEDKKIAIAIDGLEHTRREAIFAIRYELGEIHKSIKGLNPQQRVPIPSAPRAEPLEYEYLLMLEREGDETCRVKDGSRLVTINVRQLLSGIESEAQRRNAPEGGVIIYGDVYTDGGDFSGRDKSISTGERGVVVSGKVGGHLIAGDDNQVIQDSYNKITAAEIDPELKQTLTELAGAVAAIIQAFPEEQNSKVTKNFTRLVEEVTQPEPEREWYTVNIEGLIKAAENLDKLGTPVISLSKKVLSLLTGGVVK